MTRAERLLRALGLLGLLLCHCRGSRSACAGTCADPIPKEQRTAAPAPAPAPAPVSPLAAITPSRLVGGLAPLGVVFDGLGPDFRMTPPVAGDPASQLFEWDFGDPSSGSFPTNGRSRNRAEGYIAAHVYEVPGTYTVTLTITDSSGQKTAAKRALQVGAFSGSLFVSSSKGSDTSDGRSEATPLASLNTALSRARAGTRIRLKRGDSFRLNETLKLTAPGPGLFEAYGTGAVPRIEMVGKGPAFHVRASDWRITDVALAGPSKGESAQGISGNTDGGLDGLLLLRVETRGFERGFAWAKYRNYRHLNIVVAECHIQDSVVNGAYVGGEHLALLGNRIENPVESHVLRVWQAHKSVISNNVLHDPGDHHALKLHGPDYGMPYEPTRFVVVSHNDFRGDTWVVGLGAENTTKDQRVSDVVFDGNVVRATENTRVGLLVWAERVMVRNNVFDAAGSPHSYKAIVVERRGIEPIPKDVRIYHNTMVRNDLQKRDFIGIVLGEDARDVEVANNLLFSPNATNPRLLSGAQPKVLAGNVISTNPHFRDMTKADYRIQNSSDAAGRGVPLPAVLVDFDERPRPASHPDVGAHQREKSP